MHGLSPISHPARAADAALPVGVMRLEVAGEPHAFGVGWTVALGPAVTEVRRAF
ncbi:hypothetical protein EV644_10435 [Kribbella orskensis]|uniref:Uncharacterized protein n=1 Tax=Kribbella orskensis TaxID=2512216 RepID=A0ABY2BN57_9ACTN|nr:MULTISPECIES: hypothetical protein [Kribbella]TCN41653.1 hypothetical protein EV642_10335 [Kribbella sp. VKM Ac-2500]TCO25531.1 hypothetical protein EV644_10435 [Kribbella orskensis]